MLMLTLYILLTGSLAVLGVPSTPVWPEQFTAVQFQNRSGDVAINELWYDWPRGRNMIRIHNRHGPVMWHLELNNKTTFIYDKQAENCSKFLFPVGILTPDWLANATYLGTERMGGTECYKWTKSEFIDYWEDTKTRQPVRWTFLWDKADFEILEFRAGATMPDKMWEVPTFCSGLDSATMFV